MMNAYRIAILFGGLLMATPVGLAAQEQPIIQEGSRVRVSAPSISSYAVEGTVVALKPDTLTLEAEVWRRGSWETGKWDVPLSAMTGLEVGQRGGSNAGKGALLGGVIGALPGLILAIAVIADSDEGDFVNPGSSALIAPVITGTVGAGIGALIGAMSHRTTWVSVPLDDYRIDVATFGDGLGISAAIQF